MGKNRYIVKFGGLPVGVHEYEFEVGDQFFKEYENSGVEHADVQVTGVLTKQNNTMQMTVTFSGTVAVDCDRCLKGFDFPVEGEGRLTIKFGDPDETTDEMLVIPEGDDQFDLSHFIYEFVMVAIPARKVPCEIDAEAFKCDYETLAKLRELSTDKEGEEIPDNNNVWEQLNKLKFNKN
jgi:uncharacterized protein